MTRTVHVTTDAEFREALRYTEPLTIILDGPVGWPADPVPLPLWWCPAVLSARVLS